MKSRDTCLLTLSKRSEDPELVEGPLLETRRQYLAALKRALALPPPIPHEFAHDPDGLHRLRYLWLTAPYSTRRLAALLDVSQPHLIRLLRGDRRPSRALRHRLDQLIPFPNIGASRTF